jgi:hypothetical protein
MRRTLALAALGLALLTASACADVPQEEPGSTPTPTNKVTSTLADKKTTCAAYIALDAEMTTKSGPVIADLEAAQTDPVRGLSAIASMNTLISDYEAELTPIAANSADAELKTALEAELTKTRRVKADLAAAGTDPVKLLAVFENVDNKEGEKIKSLCGV